MKKKTEKKEITLESKIDDLRWLLFGIEERLDKIEKNVNIEYRDRLKAIENWLGKALKDKTFYAELNNNDTDDEKEKYIRLYSGDLAEWYKHNVGINKADYGSENHGSGIIKYLEKVRPSSLLEVGCGRGDFCLQCRRFINKVYGLDIASVKTGNVAKTTKVKFIDGEASYIPLEDNEVDYVTGFDILEHIPEHLVDKSLSELDRVSRTGMIFSISHDVCDYQGVMMHKTIKPREWWVEKLKEFGQVQIYGKTPYVDNKYIIVYKGDL
jgi:ubiquinone/menaquinone biosynthesis C-methylase UbiE